jgi:hypothetical protein
MIPGIGCKEPIVFSTGLDLKIKQIYLMIIQILLYKHQANPIYDD